MWHTADDVPLGLTQRLGLLGEGLQCAVKLLLSLGLGIMHGLLNGLMCNLLHLRWNGPHAIHHHSAVEVRVLDVDIPNRQVDTPPNCLSRSCKTGLKGILHDIWDEVEAFDCQLRPASDFGRLIVPDPFAHDDDVLLHLVDQRARTLLQSVHHMLRHLFDDIQRILAHRSVHSCLVSFNPRRALHLDPEVFILDALRALSAGQPQWLIPTASVAGYS
mmetsp:Transcript_72047/g.154264  ORF Transcript_72047/g.154264 Transcript_72047/m.154264 type:complete len:217 (+) Transcript_72047:858-1508(+)